MGDGKTFEPISDFIAAIARESRRAPGACMDPVEEDQGILGEPLPRQPTSTFNEGHDGFVDGFMVASSSANAAVEVNVEATAAPSIEKVGQPPSLSSGQVTQRQSVNNATAPSQTSNRAAVPQLQLPNSCGAVRAGSPNARQYLSASTRPQGTAQPRTVPSLHLHAASVPPLLGHRSSASTTPERPRMSGAPMISPRPVGSQQPVAGQVASNPRVMVAPGASNLRMGVTPSPGRQFT